MAINLGGGQLIQRGSQAGVQQFSQQAGQQNLQGQQILAQLSQAVAGLQLEKEKQSWDNYKTLYEQEVARRNQMDDIRPITREEAMTMAEGTGVQMTSQMADEWVQNGPQPGPGYEYKLQVRQAQKDILGSELPLFSTEGKRQVGEYYVPKEIADFTVDQGTFIKSIDQTTRGEMYKYLDEQLNGALTQKYGQFRGSREQNAVLLEATKNGSIVLDQSQMGTINQASQRLLQENQNDHNSQLLKANDTVFNRGRLQGLQNYATDTRNARDIYKPSGNAQLEGYSNSTAYKQYNRALNDPAAVAQAQELLRLQRSMDEGYFEGSPEQEKLFADMITDFQSWTMQDIVNLAAENEGYVPLMNDIDKVNVTPGSSGTAVAQMPAEWLTNIGALREAVPQFESYMTESKTSRLQEMEKQQEGLAGETYRMRDMTDAQIENMQAQSLSYLARTSGKDEDDPDLKYYNEELSRWMDIYSGYAADGKLKDWDKYFGDSWNNFVQAAARKGIQIDQDVRTVGKWFWKREVTGPQGTPATPWEEIQQLGNMLNAGEGIF